MTLDFLGKDSIRYQQTLGLHERYGEVCPILPFMFWLQAVPEVCCDRLSSAKRSSTSSKSCWRCVCGVCVCVCCGL